MRPLGTGSRILHAWPMRWLVNAWPVLRLAVCAVVCLGLLAGCRSSGIDPSGQRIFANPPLAGLARPSSPYREYPGRQLPWDNVRVVVNPSRCVAPVGSDVVLMAGVIGPDSYLRTNERVEWLLSSESPGQLVDFDRGTYVDLMLGDFTWPRKKDSHWIVTSTSRRYLRLTRETPTPSDDVCVARGQSWVTVTSPVEGSSHVLVHAPSVYGWDAKRQTATIHWVDGQWEFPSPAILSAGGRHVFTTIVTRHTDRSPRVGWQVRYEIVGGPPAGFAPDGAPSATVLTNEAGQASVEIAQAQPAAGTNTINIQVVRPGVIDGDGGEPLVVATGSTTATWSAPQLAVRKSGPAVGSVGATLSYQVAVTNAGDLPADDVAVLDEIPAGTELVSTNPPAEISGGQLRWTLGRLEARQTRTLGVDLRATRSGTVSSCAEAVASGGLRARDCATTVIGTAELAVRMTGPTSATVGDEIRYVITIENRGELPATGLMIKDRFDEGLEYAGARSPIEKELDDLAPGQDRQVGITFRVTRAGSLCHEVEVTGNGGARAGAQACVNVAPAAGPPATMPSATGQPGRAAVSVEKVGPTMAEVGQTAEFTIYVRNTGDVALTNVRIVDVCDPELVPTDTTEGRQVTDQGLIWTVPSLGVGKPTMLRIRCRCETAAAEAYNRVTVTSAEGAEAKAEARLEIRAAQPSSLLLPSSNTPGPGLRIAVADLADSRYMGQTVTYQIDVKNVSTAADEDVVLVVDVPPGLQPIADQTRGPQGVRHTVVGQTVHFEPVRTIRPDGELRYLVQTKATAPGRVKLRARLGSRRLTGELEAEEETEILSGP